MSLRQTLRSRLRMARTLGRGLLVGLPEATASDEPFALITDWMQTASDAGILLHEAITLATATPEGRPSARPMLLKGWAPPGLVFYTNHGSRKAGELQTNPHAAIVIHWPVLARVIRVEGSVERLSREESATYFHSRARGSQVGAWASRQSQVLASRSELEQRVRDAEQRFAGRPVDTPDFWGGYRLVPRRIEFWQGRAFRLHDRLVFERETPEDPWSTHRLFP